MKVILLLASFCIGCIWSEEAGQYFEPLYVIKDPNTGIQRHIFDYSHGKVNYGQVKVERTTFPPQQPRSQISNRHQSTTDEHDERTRFASRQQPEHSNYGRGQIENRYQSPVTERTKFVLQEPEYPNYARDEIQSRHQSPIIIYSEPTTSAPRGFTINQDYYDFPRNANTNRYQSPINRRYEQTQSAPSRNEIENRYQSSIERSTVSPRAFSVSQQSEYSDLPIISINNRHQSPTNRNDDDRINYYSNSNNAVQQRGQQASSQSGGKNNSPRPGEKEPIRFVGQDGITYDAFLQYDRTPKPKTSVRDYLVRFRRENN